MVLNVQGACNFIFNGVFHNWAVFSAAAIPVAVVQQDKWHYVELKFDWGGGGNEISVAAQLDGVSVLSPTTSVKPDTGAPLTWPGVMSVEFSFSAVDFSDVYVLDNLGGNPVTTTFLGDVSVLALPAIADGSHLDWAPDTGTVHFTRINEQPQDGDGSYVSTITVGATDTYSFKKTVAHEGMEAFPAKTIFGVNVNTFARKTDAGARQIAGVCVSGGGTTVGSPGAPLLVEYVATQTVFEVDPATGLAWTNTTLDAAEFGVQLIQ
jgi:hypothetical protein